jgi:hypothetical protein
VPVDAVDDVMVAAFAGLAEPVQFTSVRTGTTFRSTFGGLVLVIVRQSLHLVQSAQWVRDRSYPKGSVW